MFGRPKHPMQKENAPKMKTITDAIDTYAATGKESVSPGFREIINQMIDNNIKTEFKNDSYLDALYLTDVMFSRSQKSIRLLTGPGADSFLFTLKDSFIGALQRLAKVNGTVKIVLLDGKMPVWLEPLQKQHKNVLEVFRATANEPIKHFIVCDARMARLEEIHGQISKESNASEIKASVYFNQPIMAKVLEDHFDSIWEEVGKFQANEPHPAV